jgi:hypothetical protein
MQWLTALLAFATTMLIFAIIVSTLVELLHKVIGYRSQGLRLMLENLYDKVIAPQIVKGGTLKAADFATFIMENRAVAPREGEGEAKRGRISEAIHRFVDASVMTDIPVEVFTQKLADNRIVEAADNLTQEVIDDIAQKYEAFGKEASTLFERRARVFSVITAFVVAWAFYVHPYKLAVTYFKNPEIAQSVADRSADVHAEYRALVDRLEEAKADGSVSAADTDQLRAAIKALQDKVGDAQKQTKELANMGVPVGWPDQSDMKPCAGINLMSDCKRDIMGAFWTQPSIGSALWLLIGGLLVGLGAPFWAQAVSNLTASRDVTRKITDIVNPQGAAGTAGARALGYAPSARSTSFAAFKVSSGAQGLNTAPVAPAGAATAVTPVPPPAAAVKPRGIRKGKP